jgi:hypothetical protein
VRDYALERLRDGGSEAAARRHLHAGAAVAEASRAEHAERLVGVMRRWSARQRQLLGGADGREIPIRIPRCAGRTVRVVLLAERVSEGRQFIELALASTGEAVSSELQAEALATLCYLATEELDLGGGRRR